MRNAQPEIKSVPLAMGVQGLKPLDHQGSRNHSVFIGLSGLFPLKVITGIIDLGLPFWSPPPFFLSVGLTCVLFSVLSFLFASVIISYFLVFHFSFLIAMFFCITFFSGCSKAYNIHLKITPVNSELIFELLQVTYGNFETV